MTNRIGLELRTRLTFNLADSDLSLSYYALAGAVIGTTFASTSKKLSYAKNYPFPLVQ